jgi:hypothetical protein
MAELNSPSMLRVAFDTVGRFLRRRIVPRVKLH